jgi:prepilin-type N-terminal cleavage/methylation domain-containing protein
MSRITIRRRKGGFTLIEIMIVVLIIGILLAIAIPNFMRAREVSRGKACIANLKQIQTAKEQWAMDFKKADTATPADMTALTSDDAANEKGAYIKTAPSCPSSGAYTIGAVNVNPTCNYAGTIAPHALTAAGG